MEIIGQQESQKSQKTLEENSSQQASQQMSIQNTEQVLGTKVKICDVSVDLHDHYVQKNHDYRSSDKEFEHFYLECKVQQKLETIVCRNGRKILKFNIIDLELDQEKSLIECISYDETHDKFEPIITEGKCYRIYNPEITKANKKHTQVQNDYRLIMNKDVTEIKPMVTEKKETEANYSFKFIELHDIIRINNNSDHTKKMNLGQADDPMMNQYTDSLDLYKYVDVKVVVKTLTPKYDVISFGYGGKQYNGKFQIEVYDSNNCFAEMQMFIWGKCAEKAKNQKIKKNDKLTCANVHVKWNSQLAKYCLYCGINSRLFINDEQFE